MPGAGGLYLFKLDVLGGLLISIRYKLLLITYNDRHAIEAFKDCKYLGTRVRGDGMVGKWVSLLNFVFKVDSMVDSFSSKFAWFGYVSSTLEDINGWHMEKQALSGWQ